MSEIAVQNFVPGYEERARLLLVCFVLSRPHLALINAFFQ